MLCGYLNLQVRTPGAGRASIGRYKYRGSSIHDKSEDGVLLYGLTNRPLAQIESLAGLSDSQSVFSLQYA